MVGYFMLIRNTTNVIGLGIIVFSVFFVVVSQAEEQQKDFVPCTVCVDGDAPDPTLSVGQLPCITLEQSAQFMPADSDDCLELQLLAYRNCNCPKFPRQYCSLCSDGFYDIDEATPIVSSEETSTARAALYPSTCGEILFVRMNTVDSCADVTRYAFDCGCPGAISTEICDICGDGITPTNMENIVSVPEWGTATCQDLFFAGQAGLIQFDRCEDATLQARAICGCGTDDEVIESSAETPNNVSYEGTSLQESTNAAHDDVELINVDHEDDAESTIVDHDSVGSTSDYQNNGESTNAGHDTGSEASTAENSYTSEQQGSEHELEDQMGTINDTVETSAALTTKATKTTATYLCIHALLLLAVF